MAKKSHRVMPAEWWRGELRAAEDEYNKLDQYIRNQLKPSAKMKYSEVVSLEIALAPQCKRISELRRRMDECRRELR